MLMMYWKQDKYNFLEQNGIFKIYNDSSGDIYLNIALKKLVNKPFIMGQIFSQNNIGVFEEYCARESSIKNIGMPRTKRNRKYGTKNAPTANRSIVNFDLKRQYMSCCVIDMINKSKLFKTTR